MLYINPITLQGFKPLSISRAPQVLFALEFSKYTPACHVEHLTFAILNTSSLGKKEVRIMGWNLSCSSDIVICESFMCINCKPFGLYVLEKVTREPEIWYLTILISVAWVSFYSLWKNRKGLIFVTQSPVGFYTCLLERWTCSWLRRLCWVEGYFCAQRIAFRPWRSPLGGVWSNDWYSVCEHTECGPVVKSLCLQWLMQCSQSAWYGLCSPVSVDGPLCF